mgnify:CR=1 FL=1
MTPKTTPAKGRRLPWTPKVKTPKKPPVLVNVEELVIASDPLPTGRAAPQHKYEAKFKAMKVGQNIVCKPDEVGKISCAMRKYIAVNNIKARVITQQIGTDGKGRVWMAAP